MTGLAGIQAAFQDYLLGASRRLEQMLAPGRLLPGAEMAEIYGGAYVMRLIEVLGEDFPALHMLLGDEGFEKMARAYVLAHPSKHYDIRWFGRYLAGFLAATEPWSGLGEAEELARFEWALGEAFDAADAAPMDEADLAAVPPQAWAGLVFSFTPSLRRLDLNWDVPGFWKAQDGGATPDGPPERLDAPRAWALWRDQRQMMVRYRPLAGDAAAALDAAVNGASFGVLIERLAETKDAELAPMRAAELLRAWVDDGLLTGLSA